MVHYGFCLDIRGLVAVNGFVWSEAERVAHRGAGHNDEVSRLRLI